MYWLVYRHLLKQIGMLKVRYLICGAAPISEELFSFYIALGVPIMNGFGMTELHNIPCMALPGDAMTSTIGYPLPGWEVKKGEDAELMVRGPIGFKGYAGERGRLQEVLDSQGWLHTGDLCEIYANGYVSIIGRKKDVLITSGGKNISPELIENKLKASPYISEAVVIGEGRNFLTCLVELDGDAVGDWLQMRGQSFSTLRDMAGMQSVLDLIEHEIEQVNQSLARVETIKKFRIIPRDLSHDDGEMTPTRKVKRSILEKQFQSLIDDMY
jgi:long-chain acyl-CoA synthetase